jgi:hypothetical protein
MNEERMKHISALVGTVVVIWIGLAILWLGTVGLYILTQRMMGLC